MWEGFFFFFSTFIQFLSDENYFMLSFLKKKSKASMDAGSFYFLYFLQCGNIELISTLNFFQTNSIYTCM